jgi:small-conductance mechanosensitive channel
MTEYLNKMDISPAVLQAAYTLAAVIVVIILSAILKRSVARKIKDSDTRYSFRKFISVVTFVLAVLIIAAVYGSKLRNVAVILGVAGAGIAFALQEVIASVAGWMAISLGRFYSTGDRVMMGGIKGDVIDIGVLRTTVMELGEWVNSDQYTGRIVRIANSFVFKEPVFNYSGDFPFLWDEITVPIKYGSDYKLAREILNNIVNETVGDYTSSAKSAWAKIVIKYRIEAANVEPMIFMTANDNWVEFAVRYLVDYKQRRTTKNLLFTSILDELEKTGGHVSIASTTINIVDAPPLDINIRK